MFELVTPVNPVGVLKYLGRLVGVFAVLLIVPVTAGLLMGDYSGAAIFASTAIVAGITGTAIFYLLPEHELEVKDTVVLAALAFPVAAFIAALPLSAISGMTFADTLFESISGVTTTGLSLAPAESSPLFYFTRSFLQWIGGLGIVVFMLAVIIHPGTTAFRLYALNYGDEKIRPQITQAVHQLGLVYLSITALALLILLIAGMGLFDAVCHTLSAVSTGGFSTGAESIAAFNSGYIQAAVVICCLMGSVSFSLYPALRENRFAILNDPQVRALFVFVLIGTALLFIIFAGILSFSDASGDAAFQAVSAITTSGFSTLDLSAVPVSAKMVISAMMCIGGGVGSTTGGIKLLRIIILLEVIYLVFNRYFLPRETITPLKVAGHVIDYPEVYQIVTLFLLYITFLCLSTLIFVCYGVPLENAFFEVSSAIGTVGLSTGVTNPAMPAVLKAVLCVDMILGRIEIIPLCIMLMPRTWFGGRRP